MVSRYLMLDPPNVLIERVEAVLEDDLTSAHTLPPDGGHGPWAFCGRWFRRSLRRGRWWNVGRFCRRWWDVGRSGRSWGRGR